MQGYIKFNYDRGITRPDEKVDLNGYRVRDYLRALVYGGGTVNQCVIIDFVMESTKQLCEFRSVQHAWESLDEEEQHFVLAFRYMMLKLNLGDLSNFPHRFYTRLVDERYDVIHDEFIRSNYIASEDQRLEVKKEKLEEAESELNVLVRSDLGRANWSVKCD